LNSFWKKIVQKKFAVLRADKIALLAVEKQRTQIEYHMIVNAVKAHLPE